MATVTGLTAERMIEMENATVIAGHVEANHLILDTRGGDEIDAGYVAGPTGPSGGAFVICTSSTRPSLSTGNEGVAIYETDTDLIRVWSGTRWMLQPKVVCTSTTRPTGLTTADEGIKIYETDSNAEYIWTGSLWVAAAGGGGAFIICTSTTRPAFSVSDEGKAIYETDTDLTRVWTGTRWRLQEKIICTSTTRPAMTAADEGVKIYETDSNSEYTWSGTAWIPDAVSTTPAGIVVITLAAVADSGYSMCDGGTLSRTGVGARLFGVIGTAYGPGNGTSTFNKPDMRGYGPMGFGGGIGGSLGSKGGELVHALSVGEMPQHDHPFGSAGSHSHSITESAHNHAVTNGNHAHGVNDPGHFHAETGIGTVAPFGAAAGGDVVGNVNTVTGSKQTGLTVANAPSAVSLSPASTGIAVQPANIGGTIGLSGGNVGHNNLQPYMLVNWQVSL